MRTATAKFIVYSLSVVFVYVVFARLAHSGADIPVDPHYIVLEDRVPVRNTKPVMIWTASKQYRNDRVFAGGFQ